MRRILAVILAAVLALGLLAGCSSGPAKVPEEPAPQEEGPQGETPPVAENHLPGAETGPAALERPETKIDVISLEGQEEPFSFTLLKAENIGFTTYIPEDIIPTVVSTEEGDAVVAYTNFAGQQRDDAYLSFLLYREGITLEEAIAGTRELLAAEGYEFPAGTEEHRSHPWAVEEFRFTKEDDNSNYVGRAAFGNRGNRVFRVMTHMPAEFGDGFGARIARIIADMEWFTTAE
ncbi:MAG TPA: hypothetical protein GX518_01695 [Firmicutes bacterium]|nr:hypothetical protein [Bacillota bacterium]